MKPTAPPPAWVRLSIVIPRTAEEFAIGAFLRDDDALRATGIVVEDGQVGALAVTPTPLPADAVRVSTFVSGPEAELVRATLVARLQTLVEEALLETLPHLEEAAVDDADWRNRWKEFFHVLRIGRRLVIRPPWRTHDALPEDIVLTIEPGLAFGTGGHQTTQLCLAAVERALDAGPKDAPLPEMLDVGCGSGVLAIAALRLGVGHALAVDIDPAAVTATHENAALNGVSDRIAADTTPMEALAAAGRQFPLVTANIISSTLLALADPLVATVAQGGTLVLSGLLAYEYEEFRAAFERDCPALTLIAEDTMDEWLALTYLRTLESQA